MQKDLIFVFFLFLLVISASDQNRMQENTIDFEPMKFVLSHTEMPIYELVTPEVNESYVQSLASSLFGLHDLVAQVTEGIYFVNWSNSYLEVDSSDGSIWFADYDRLWNVSSGDALPNATECQEMAESWLDEKGLVPANADFVGVLGTTNMTIYNVDTHVTHSKLLNYHFNYNFVIPDNDIPIAESSAGIKVVIGEAGEVSGPAQNVVGFNWKWRDINPTPYSTAVLIEFDSILETYGIPSDSVVTYSLMYKTGEEDSNNDLLYPVYDVTLTETNDGYVIEYNLEFAATEFQPYTGIIQPSGPIIKQPGEPITFDCIAQFGTPPYKYQWYSPHDGVLSYSENFTTTSLSEVIKENTIIPHPIILTVQDANKMECYDLVAVTIDSTAVASIDPNIVIIALGSIALLVVFLILVKKKGFLVVPFLFLIFSAFMFLPITSAYSQDDVTNEFRPRAPTGAFDDDTKEVGVEWVGNSYDDSPLWNSPIDAGKFYHHMATTGGYSQEFNWGEWNAWETDFRATEFNGNDSEWIDAVDIVFYKGHGNPCSITFTSEHDDEYLYFSDLKLGDGDLETLAMESCDVMPLYGPCGSLWSLWGPVLQGVHQICGFATSAKNTPSMGMEFALQMTGLYPLPALTIVESWFKAGYIHQNSDKIVAVFYGTNSTNPFQPQLDDPINDHAKGFGYVCSDPTPDAMGWYVYITSNC
ncbi:MAG: immunoglobulin domain-containing protein [Candidatus Thorarchaeota archaeon]|nr:immunoglobulin domain-containing protein [Candidatus Thorarchaeota archaeon]